MDTLEFVNQKIEEIKSEEAKPPKITHCTVSQDNLLEALKTVAPFAAKKSTLPVLSHANLVMSGGWLAVSATTLEQYALCYIGAQLPDDDFAIAMPVKAFSEVIGMLNGLVNLSVNHKTARMTINSQILTEKKGQKTIKQENTLLGIDSAEFPILPNCDQAVAKFGGSDLKRVIEHCLFAAADDESRPILTAMCFTVKDGLITVAAADGFRLSVDTIHAVTELNGTYLIPASLFKDLHKHIDNDTEITMRVAMKEVKHLAKDGTVESITIEPNTVEFEAGSIVMGSQIVDGKFPDYNTIIPKDASILATVNRKETLAALKAALVFLKGSNYRGGMLSIRANRRNVMLVESHDADLGDSCCEVEVSSFVGYNVFMGFNLEYLQDALLACRENLVTIGFQAFETKQTNPPIKIVEGNFTHVVMPMHHDGTYAYLEQPEYADMNQDQLAQVAGPFAIEGEEGEYTNLLAAIEADTASAAEEHTVIHVLSLPDRLPIWEIDRREIGVDDQDA